MQLVDEEKYFLKLVSSYITAEQGNFTALKSNLQTLKRLSDSEDPEKTMSDPVVAYKLIRRLVVDWPYITESTQIREYKDYQEWLRSDPPRFPTWVDVKGAALGLITLQEIYKLYPEDIIRETPVNVDEAFRVGFVADQHHKYQQAFHWRQRALSCRYSTGGGNPRLILAPLKEEIEWNEPRIIRYHDILSDKEIETLKNIARPQMSDVDIGGATVFPKIGVALKPKKGSAVFWFKLHKNGTSDPKTQHAGCPVLLGNKWDFQELLFSDVLKIPSEEDLESAALALIRLQETYKLYPVNLTKESFNSIRTFTKERLLENLGSSAYHFGSLPVAIYFYQQLLNLGTSNPDIFTLNTESTNSYEALCRGEVKQRTSRRQRTLSCRYSTGGGNPRLILAPLKEEFEWDEPRIIRYHDIISDKEIEILKNISRPLMSDVEIGGATVFPEVGVALQPKKGSAVFWYNLHKNGDLDLRTAHAGCPVLVGNKWDQVIQLVEEERTLLKLTHAYIIAEAENLERILEILKLHEDPAETINDPAAAYKLIKRLRFEWFAIVELTQKTLYKEFQELLYSDVLKIPLKRDLDGAALGLIRLQEMYKLYPENITRETPFSVEEAYYVGFIAYEEDKFQHAFHWFLYSLNEFNHQDALSSARSVTKKDLLKYLGSSAYHFGSLHVAIYCYQQLLNLGETSRRQRTLSCRYSTRGGNPRLILAPLKEEIEWDEPRIVRYHDMISDKEIEILKSLSRPYMSDVKIGGATVFPKAGVALQPISDLQTLRLSVNSEDPVRNMNDSVVVYKLIRRLRIQWLSVLQTTTIHLHRDYQEWLLSDSPEFPSMEDLEAAALGLIRLQEIYKLDPEDITNGTPFSEDEAFYVGKVAYQQKKFQHAFQWFLYSLEMLNDPESIHSIQSVTRQQLLEYLGSSRFHFGSSSVATDINKLLLHLGETTRRQRTLSCRYSTGGGNPRLILAPLKEEVEWDEPRIIRYHDILSDKEIEILKDISRPQDVEDDRIATFLTYMSDVEIGGATVFPEIGIALKPEKGSAVFWYNLHKNGDVDLSTEHAGCPVLRDNKWVANKWIHEFGQEFTRPCSLSE
ncbi:Prolyl 4-hydroxylase subunit alpha-1 [Triplophysa tibetana]|uniref:procollagen-proline 4-dioxygenase n=1 Tax=Triplophysa tibetana TaxID=1572043 RepID=A0A5A9PCY6_9TELE|nr:Prolyl 4-hydroxylase subunit alpha-1 [Triplophysa tibetana]